MSSPKNPPPDYVRVRIRGRLRLMSELHVGDGGESPFDAKKRGSARDNPTSYLTVCTDARGQPYLPGNTLRGALRAQAREAGDPLFGPDQFRSAAEMKAGAVRVCDAFLEGSPDPPSQHCPYWSGERKTLRRSGIGIDAITGTVREGALFHHEMVPRGMSFAVRIDCVEISKNALQALLNLLERRDGSICSGIGAGRGKGWGLLQWSLDRDASKGSRGICSARHRQRQRDWS